MHVLGYQNDDATVVNMILFWKSLGTCNRKDVSLLGNEVSRGTSDPEPRNNG